VRNLLQVSQFALNGYHVLIVLLHAVTQAFNPVQITRICRAFAWRQAARARASCRRASAAFLRSAIDFILQYLTANIVAALLRARVNARKVCRAGRGGCPLAR